MQAEFNDFLGVLRPAQRRELGRRMHHRRGPREHFERLLERFDADGNNAIDASEVEEAQRFFEAKQAEQEERRRQHMLERFDENGNGALDSDEQAAARATMSFTNWGPRPESACVPSRKV